MEDKKGSIKLEDAIKLLQSMYPGLSPDIIKKALVANNGYLEPATEALCEYYEQKFLNVQQQQQDSDEDILADFGKDFLRLEDPSESYTSAEVEAQQQQKSDK